MLALYVIAVETLSSHCYENRWINDASFSVDQIFLLGHARGQWMLHMQLQTDHNPGYQSVFVDVTL